MSTQSHRRTRGVTRERRGVVAVEFAVVAPILLALTFGILQMGRAFEMQTLLDTAAREGARFASIDRDGLVAIGQTANQKLMNDVKNFLASNGVPKDAITVSVKSHANPTADFDLDDPANDLKLFDVNISVNFSAISLQPVAAGDDYALHSKVVFRNGRATISQ